MSLGLTRSDSDMLGPGCAGYDSRVLSAESLRGEEPCTEAHGSNHTQFAAEGALRLNFLWKTTLMISLPLIFKNLC